MKGKRYPAPKKIRESKRVKDRKLECWKLKNLYLCICDAAAASVIDGSLIDDDVLGINASILIESHPRVASNAGVTCQIMCGMWKTSCCSIPHHVNASLLRTRRPI